MPVRDPMRLKFWEVLSRADLDKIHDDTLTVLEQTGVDVHEDRSRTLLAAAGARVEGKRVFIGPGLVRDALDKAPKEITIYNREGESAMRLAPGYVYYGTGSDVTCYIDPATHERRRTDLDSIRMTARLADALPNLDFVMSMGTAPEAPAERADQHHFAAMAESTTKPIMFTAQSEQGAKDIARMCSAVSGGGDAFAAKPFAILYAMPTAPLSHTKEALSVLLAAAEAGIPAVYSAAPLMGASGPITIAGSLVVANAEMLSGLVIQQLHRPGAGFIHGPLVGPLHMRTMINHYCGPESTLACVAEAQLCRYYNLPVFHVGGSSDSKLLDQQAAAEASMSLLTAAIAGGNLIHDVGYLESGLCASPELMTFSDEIIDQVRFILRGIDVSDQSNLLGDIAEVGPGGTFLYQESTLQRFRETVWYGHIIDRNIHEEWIKAGAENAGARIRRRTLELLADHKPKPLDADTHAEVWAIATGRA